MAQNELLKQIVKELERAKSPSTFCTHGKIDFEGADVSIDGVGKIELPMRTVDVKRLFPVAVQAPYGKRTETIVDTNVRDTLEIPATSVTYSAKFEEALRSTIKNVAKTLQLAVSWGQMRDSGFKFQ